MRGMVAQIPFHNLVDSTKPRKLWYGIREYCLETKNKRQLRGSTIRHDGRTVASSSLSQSPKQRALKQLLEEKGQDSFFSAFEGRDPEDFRSLDKDGFVDAVVDFAPGRRWARMVHELEEKRGMLT